MKKEFWTVIHLNTQAQLERNLSISKHVGATGAMLIHHDGNQVELTNLAFKWAKQHYGESFRLGCNMLCGMPSYEIKEAHPACLNVWSDYSGYNAIDNKFDEAELTKIIEAKVMRPARFRFWASFAFKYQHHVDPLNYNILRTVAPNLFDVLVTSGDATGKAANLNKVKAIREHWVTPNGIRLPLAIASGITPDNVRDFLPDVDIVLCATGISETFYDLDPVKAKAVAEACHNWK